MMGAKVDYLCNTGYHNVGEASVFVCNAAGQWEGAVLCQGTVIILSDAFKGFVVSERSEVKGN